MKTIHQGLLHSASAVVLGTGSTNLARGGSDDDLQYWSFAVKCLEQRNRDLQAENQSLHASLQRALVKAEEYERIIAYLRRHEDDSKPISKPMIRDFAGAALGGKGIATAHDDGQQPPDPSRSHERRATIAAHNAAMAAEELRQRDAVPPVHTSTRGKDPSTRVVFSTSTKVSGADVETGSSSGPHDGAADRALRLPSIAHRDASVAADAKPMGGYARRYSDAYRAAEERAARETEAAADGGARGMKRSSSHSSNPASSPGGDGSPDGDGSPGGNRKPSRSRGVRLLKDMLLDFGVRCWNRASHVGEPATSSQPRGLRSPCPLHCLRLLRRVLLPCLRTDAFGCPCAANRVPPTVCRLPVHRAPGVHAADGRARTDAYSHRKGVGSAF